MRFAGPVASILSSLAAAALLAAASPAMACDFFDWLFHRNQQPVAVAYPVNPCNPCNACDPCGGTCQPGMAAPLAAQPILAQPTTLGYRGPVFRSIFAPVPVTAYRPVAGVDPNGSVATVLRPCQTSTTMTQRVPYYSYRPLLRPSIYGYPAAQTSYYAPVYGQMSLYAPGLGQPGYAQPTTGLDHAYEGVGPAGYAAPAMVAPAMAAPSLGGPGCPTCNQRIPLTTGYPPVMSPQTTMVAPATGYSNYPGRYAGTYPGTVVTQPAAPLTLPSGPAVVSPAGGANVAPTLNPAEVQRVPLNALPQYSPPQAFVPANAVPLNPPLTALPNKTSPNLVPVTPSAAPTGGVYYPKPSVPTPNANLKLVPDLDPPTPPQVKPAPPLLNPNDRTAQRAVRPFESVPIQWAVAPIQTAEPAASPVQPAVFTAPAKWDDSGWRTEK